LTWNDFQLDPQCPTPLYRQLSDQIAARIRRGVLPDGTRLPPTRELAALVGLNRTTVAAAYEALESSGLLKAHVGRGSYVSLAAPRAPFDWESHLRGPAPERALTSQAAPAQEGWMDFSSFQPAHHPAALKTLRQAAARELAAHGDAILRLGSPAGYPPLREQLTRYMASIGALSEGDELLVTSGCQQGLDLVAKTLVAPGDTVLIEDPVYPGARDLFLAAGAEVAGVPVESGGLSLAALEREFSRRQPRLLLVTPNFQNPTGATLPLAARRDLLRLASRFQAPVVENDVYAGLRYRGEELASLKSLDPEGRVIYLRSFSKTAFPGLRVGWCVAPRPIARRLLAAKQLTDLHTDQLSQAVLCRLWSDGSLQRRQEQLRRQGAARLAAVLEACRTRMPPSVTFAAPEGGLHLWLQLPDPLEAGELLGPARSQKILFVPGRVFAVSRPAAGALRFTFAGVEPEKIRHGVAVLARLIGAQAPVAAGLGEGNAPALV
jgi:2-aminoadipate transaminase